MARNRWKVDKPIRVKATIASVEAHLASGNLAAAAVAIRRLHADQPTTATLQLYRRTLTLQMHQALDARDDESFTRLMTQAELLRPDDADWLQTKAMLLARGGRLPQALMMLPAHASDAVRQLAFGHAADCAIINRSASSLPEEFHPPYQAVCHAFEHYEQGKDETARQHLQGVGLHSPFLDWKLLLRGLMAYTARDAETAVENWKRLHPQRVPWRLAAPFRAELDEEFARLLPGNQQQWRQAQFQLTISPVQAGIDRLARELPQQGLTESHWSLMPHVWSQLKREHPDLAEAFQRCMYLAILSGGGANQIRKFQRVFGKPADDPNFHRLRGLAMEEMGLSALAAAFWRDYARWLESNQAGWGEAERRRALSLLYERIARLLLESEQLPSSHLVQAIRRLVNQIEDGHQPLTPEKAFRLAVKADPSAYSARAAYFEFLTSRNSHLEAIAIGREALALKRYDAALQVQVAQLLKRTGQAEEALIHYQAAATLNPLEETYQNHLRFGIIAAARQAMYRGDDHKAEALLEDLASMLEGLGGKREYDLLCCLLLALRATLCRLRHQTVTAAKLELSSLDHEFTRLAVRLILHVDAQLAKLPAKQRSTASQAFQSELKRPQSCTAIVRLVAAYEELIQQGLAWRGCRTLPAKYEKMLLSLMMSGSLSAEQRREMIRVLEPSDNWPLKQRLSDRLLQTHPMDVEALLFRAHALLCAPALPANARYQGEYCLAQARARLADIPDNLRSAMEKKIQVLERYVRHAATFEKILHRWEFFA